MTEAITGSNEGQDTQVPATPVNIPQEAQSNNEAATSGERLFKQQEVNEIVGRVRREAAERNQRREPPVNAGNDSQAQVASQPLSNDDFRRIAAEEAHRLMEKSREDAYRSAQEQEAQRIADEFFTKLETGKAKYQDFDKVMGEVELKAIPHIVQLANMVDNTPDVMYELASNPTKIAAIQQLIQISPKLAYAEINKLSQSIKANEQAANTKLPNKPLSQMRPSATGTDSGALSISDLRKKYRV